MNDATFQIALDGAEPRPFVVPADGGHAVVAQSIFEGHAYPIIPFAHVSVIVDIGANCGAASAWFRLYYPNAHIRAYEPHPTAFAYLSRNASTFNIDARNKGLYLYPKTVFLRDGVSDCGTVVASICPHPTNTDAGHELKLASATDEVGDLLIDILKIDTEGCEIPILRGIRYWEPAVIYLETHSDDDRQEVDDMLYDSHILFVSRTFQPHKTESTYVRRNILPAEANAQAFIIPNGAY